MDSATSNFELARIALSSAYAPGIGRMLKISRLERAIRHFNQSLKANSPSTTSKTERLIGLLDAQLKLSHIMGDDHWSNQVVASLRHTLSEALSTADVLLLNPFSESVLADVIASIETVRDRAESMATTSAQRVDFFRWLNSRLMGMNMRQKLLPTKLLVFEYLTQEVYHQAVRDFEAERWAKALNALRALEAELGSSVELQARLVEEGKLDVDIAVLRNIKSDVDLLVLSCEGSQLLKTGDHKFARAMNCDPEDMLGWAQLAQDDYRGALSRVTERDIEMEGMTIFRLARFYSKVTKMPSHAHTLYLRAVQLAATLAPSAPKGMWYIECTKAVQDYRDELANREENAWHNQRKPFLAELEPEIQEIGAKGGLSHLEFARWIWTEWPPKTEGSADCPPCPSQEGKDIKKLYLKVIQRYHPDRNSKFGGKWHVLAEEISKALNGRYGLMKGL